MKKMLVLLAVAVLCLPTMAQQVDTVETLPVNVENLLGKWAMKGDVNITCILQDAGKFEMGMLMEMDEDSGDAIAVEWGGSWKLEDSSVSLKMDPQSINFRYLGENKEMGQMIEQMMMANKEKAVGELAGNDGGMTFFVYTLTADTLVVTDEAEISDDTEEPELKTFVRVK